MTSFFGSKYPISKNNPLLSVKNLSIDFTSDKKCFHAVKKISFDLLPKEILAIVGESGSGKSVTGLSLTKLLPYPVASHPSGTVTYIGQDLLSLSQESIQNVRGSEISYIFQEPLTALNPLQTVFNQIDEVLQRHTNQEARARKRRINDLIDQVELGFLNSRLNAYPHELSGGQRQRIMIAMALAVQPKILIADEPTTALDVTTQYKILHLLKKLVHDHNLSIILITHDLNVVQKVADRVVVMKQGRIVEAGETKKVLETPQASYTQTLIRSEPSGGPLTLPPQAQRFYVKNLKVFFPIKKGFFKRTTGYIRAVDGLSFKLHPGETLGIVGESGSGKSTLAQACLRMIQLHAGEIYLDETRLDTLNNKAMLPYRRQIQMVFQDPFGSLSPRMTAEEIISEGLYVHRPLLNNHDRQKLIRKTLQDVGLETALMTRYPHEFSGGQRQRLAIGRVLILRPKVVILDEPTSALDRAVQAQIIDLLRYLQERYALSYIFISHDLKVISALSHRVVVMKNGQVVEVGSCKNIFHSPKESYTKSLLEASL